MLRKLFSVGTLIIVFGLLWWFHEIAPIWFPKSRPEYVMIGMIICAVFPAISAILIVLSVFLNLFERDNLNLTLHVERKLRHLLRQPHHDWDYLEAQVIELDEDRDPPYQR